MYVMIPSNIFFFTFGFIVGFVSLIIILIIINKKIEKKNKQTAENFLKGLNINKKDDR